MDKSIEKLGILLEKAIILASENHKGQKDKGGNPYILLPLAVMNRVHAIDEKIVAALHDVVEDTDITFDDLRHVGFFENIISAIDSLTRRNNETYMEFIIRCNDNSLAKTVKIADIEENMDLSRIPNPTEQDYSRLKRYDKALKLLSS